MAHNLSYLIIEIDSGYNKHNFRWEEHIFNLNFQNYYTVELQR